MNILTFSSFLIIVILLIWYFSSDTSKNGVKLLVIFGIGTGVFALGLNYISNSCFGASTPIEIKTKNLTAQKLKIYAIAFWGNNWNGNGSFVNYNKEIEPNETSEFCIENDSRDFWLVAKNRNNEILYLNEIKTNENSFNFEIIKNQNIDPNKIQIAEELTFKTDKIETFEKYLVWTNIILIGFLITSLIKNKNVG